MNIIKKTLTILIIILALATIVSAVKYKYNEGVEPHTRYNYLLYKCYYYYGYGRCEVDLNECKGVGFGKNKWVDLGDACNRNKAPILEGAKDIEANEGEIITIPGTCTDDDPVNITFTGWADDREEYAGYNDAGTHKTTITCTDSFGEKDSQEITIKINNKNRPPFFKIITHLIEKPK